jgi:hypothetical protein
MSKIPCSCTKAATRPTKEQLNKIHLDQSTASLEVSSGLPTGPDYSLDKL